MNRSASTLHARAFQALCALPIAFLLTTGCHSADKSDDTASALPIAPIAVASRAPLSNTLNVAGEFLPFQEVELHAKVAGYIRHISVDIGDKVHTGEVLATLDIPELTAQVAGADANVLETQEQITRAKSEVLRAQADYDAVHSAAQRLQQVSTQRPGLIAQQELDDALAKDRAAAAQVDAAKSAQSAVQQQLGVSRAGRQQVSAMADYSRIVAPFNGIVTSRFADTGSLIQAGTSNAGSAPVVKIAQIDILRLRLPVPESLAPFVHDGDTASVHVQALGETFPGKITRSAGELDPTTRTMQVEIDVPNTGNKLSPGMYADVALNIQRTGNALVVPIQAVDQNGSQPFVMLVNTANMVEKRPVTIGVSTADRVEITRGLTDGDKVIVANLSSYQSGERVAPQTSTMVHLQTSGGDE